MNRHIYIAGGCFWGVEHYFKQVNGVISTEVGYANGNIPNPTYKEVYTDTTGYAECVHIEYDSELIDIDFIVKLFFAAIDPTSLNKQGDDVGTRYRTGIYYTEESDMSEIINAYNRESARYQEPVVVEVEPLKNFYKAEDYHQDYLDKNPDGYCHLPVALFKYARSAKK